MPEWVQHYEETIDCLGKRRGPSKTRSVQVAHYPEAIPHGVTDPHWYTKHLLLSRRARVPSYDQKCHQLRHCGNLENGVPLRMSIIPRWCAFPLLVSSFQVSSKGIRGGQVPRSYPYQRLTHTGVRIGTSTGTQPHTKLGNTVFRITETL
jgi:hypothetical protein